MALERLDTVHLTKRYG